MLGESTEEKRVDDAALVHLLLNHLAKALPNLECDLELAGTLFLAVLA